MSSAGDRSGRAAAERLDTLENSLPSSVCQARTCHKLATYEWAGEWGVYWLCPEHRRIYTGHDRVLSRIRNSRRKRYI